MKRFLCLSVFCALLGGCAGSASEFECNATTSDRCMTMEQAKGTPGESRLRAGCPPWLSCQPPLSRRSKHPS